MFFTLHQLVQHFSQSVAALWPDQLMITPARALEISSALWMLLILWWVILLFRSKSEKRRESVVERLSHLVPVTLGFYLVFRPEIHIGLLAKHFVPLVQSVLWLGVLLSSLGVLVAIWARWTLGDNWSASVTIKAGHELIHQGPYRWIRHPIYTGMLVALAGTVLAIGQLSGLLGFAIVLFSFYRKARREERFLAREFGASFAEHLARTGMFLPRMI